MTKGVWGKIWSLHWVNWVARSTTRPWEDIDTPWATMVFLRCPKLLELSISDIRKYDKFTNMKDYHWFENDDGKVIGIKYMNLNEPDPSLRWVVECSCWKFHFMKWNNIKRVQDGKNLRNLLCYECSSERVKEIAQI